MQLIKVIYNSSENVKARKLDDILNFCVQCTTEYRTLYVLNWIFQDNGYVHCTCTEIYLYLLDVLLIFNAYVQKYVCTGCPNYLMLMYTVQKSLCTGCPPIFNAYVHSTGIFMYWMSSNI